MLMSMKPRLSSMVPRSPGRSLVTGLRLPGLGRKVGAPMKKNPGTMPGIESIPDRNHRPEPGQVTVRLIEYGPGHLEEREIPLEELDAFLESPAPEGRVQWINVDGLHAYVVDRFRQSWNLHTLAAEDVLSIPQRPKLEAFDDNLFIVFRMLMLGQENLLLQEQVSLFFFPRRILTFQERAGDVWDPIRKRLARPESRFRRSNASYLLYALLDATVDHVFPILETYGEMLEGLEREILAETTDTAQQRVHAVKRDLLLLRRVMWPLRELVLQVQRDDLDCIPDETDRYLRDVQDHANQVIDIIEAYREMAVGLSELHMASVSNRMNEVMKVLTLLASFFIPLTFLAGVYGMNFEHIPELAWPYAYPVFWMTCAVISSFLFVYFKRKGWIGRR